MMRMHSALACNGLEEQGKWVVTLLSTWACQCQHCAQPEWCAMLWKGIAPVSADGLEDLPCRFALQSCYLLLNSSTMSNGAAAT